MTPSCCNGQLMLNKYCSKKGVMTPHTFCSLSAALMSKVVKKRKKVLEPSQPGHIQTGSCFQSEALNRLKQAVPWITYYS